MDIARASISNPVNTWVLILICLVGGIVGLSSIGRLEDPAFTVKEAKVFTRFVGASAEKVEREITEPLEIAIQQMGQVLRVTSISKPGISEISVKIKSHYDAHEVSQIWDELRKRLRDAAPQLPASAGAPQVYDSFGDVYGLYYAFTGSDFSPHQLREFSRLIRRELLVVPGVSQVAVAGVPREQITVRIDPTRLSRLGISFPDIKGALQYGLRPHGHGRLMVDGQRIRIPVASATDRLSTIANLSLGVPGSTAKVRLSDIADLRVEVMDIPDFRVRHNGQSAITLAVSVNSDENVVDVGLRVAEKARKVLTELPVGLEMHTIYDQAKIVEEATGGFIFNLQVSVLVVSLTLCLFMGWRAGAVVASVLVLTVMGSVLLMWLFDIEMERISLGAMVIAMGMLVDNAIVVAEGMLVGMERGRSATCAASDAVKRTQWPLLGATVIGIAAFSGIGLSDDTTGEFLFSLFAVILISLMLSWLLAITVVPLLGSYIFRQGKASGADPYGSLSYLTYRTILTRVLKHRWLSATVLVLITVASYMAFGFVKQGFFAPSNTPLFFIHYWGPQTRDIRVTEMMLEQAEKLVMEHSEVAAVTTFVGRGADRFTLTYSPQAANESYGMMMVRTHSRDIIDALGKTVKLQLSKQDPDAQVFIERKVFGPSGGAKLEVRLSGPDLAQLRRLAEQTVSAWKSDPALRDIRHNWREKEIILSPGFDEYTAGIAGITRAEFSDAIQFSTGGLQLGNLRNGNYSYPVVVKSLEEEAGSNTQSLYDAQIWSASQRRYVPLRQIATEISAEVEDVLIQRRNRLRTITVMAEPGEHENAAQALARIRPLTEMIKLPEGYTLEWGGEYESSSEAQQELGAGLPIGFLVMFLITVLLFGKLRQPLIIWLIVPMAVCGVVIGLLLAGMPFGFMSLLGFLSLFGMLIKNAIVLVEAIDQNLAEGIAPSDALLQASLSRLRPVYLAAITTVLGMSPLLSDAFFADMSVTIMSGLTFATVLTLLAVPVLYSLFFNIKLESV